MHADCWLLTLEHRDRFLSCSDGLTTELSDEEIAEVLADCDSPRDAADRLVARANETGGRDNITALVVDVTTAVADPAAPRHSRPGTADEEEHDTVDLTAFLPLAPRGLSNYRLPQED